MSHVPGFYEGLGVGLGPHAYAVSTFPSEPLALPWAAHLSGGMYYRCPNSAKQFTKTESATGTCPGGQASAPGAQLKRLKWRELGV